MKNDPKNNIFTEDLDYSKTTNESIWGNGDPETLTILKQLISQKRFYGNWLHFAAGDGRYNTILLREVDSIVATDIDMGALEKLQRITPKSLSSKLTVQTQNITLPFSFNSNQFDGVFNTGTLHLFSQQVLDQIFHEVYRVLKTQGLFLFDFATDIQRLKQDGSFVGSSDIKYSEQDAKLLLKALLSKLKFKSTFTKCSVPPEEVTAGEGTYMFSCNYWVVLAEK